MWLDIDEWASSKLAICGIVVCWLFFLGFLSCFSDDLPKSIKKEEKNIGNILTKDMRRFALLTNPQKEHHPQWNNSPAPLQIINRKIIHPHDDTKHFGGIAEAWKIWDIASHTTKARGISNKIINLKCKETSCSWNWGNRQNNVPPRRLSLLGLNPHYNYFRNKWLTIE